MQMQKTKYVTGVFRGLTLLGWMCAGVVCGTLPVCAQEEVAVENEILVYESDLELDALEAEQEGLQAEINLEYGASQDRSASGEFVSGDDVPPGALRLKTRQDAGTDGSAQAAAGLNRTGPRDQGAGEIQTDPLKPVSEEDLEAELAASQKPVLREDQILQINESLRRAIEQNRRLQDEKKKLDQQLRTMRGEQRIQENRVLEMQAEVDLYQDRVMRAVQMQEEFDATVRALRSRINAREDALLERISLLQQELAEQSRPPEVAEQKAALEIQGEHGSVLVSQKEGLDVIHLLDDLDQMRRQMREDEAKVHYNMGNIFFHQGLFDEALVEYEKALELVPSDAGAHFNIAYIAGDYLHDYERAIAHFKQYLRLNPGAEDAPLVEEKIIEAQLYVRTRMDREVDREVRKNRPYRLYNW